SSLQRSSSSWWRSPASAHGRRSTSPCAHCAGRMRFRKKISPCATTWAASPPSRPKSYRRPGVRGVATPCCISGKTRRKCNRSISKLDFCRSVRHRGGEKRPRSHRSAYDLCRRGKGIEDCVLQGSGEFCKPLTIFRCLQKPWFPDGTAYTGHHISG